MVGGKRIVKTCAEIYIYIVEHRVTGLTLELHRVYSELKHISQQYLCVHFLPIRKQRSFLENP